MPQLPSFPESSLQLPRLEVPQIPQVPQTVVSLRDDASRISSSMSDILDNPPYPDATIQSSLNAAKESVTKALGQQGITVDNLSVDLSPLYANPKLTAFGVLFLLFVVQRIRSAQAEQKAAAAREEAARKAAKKAAKEALRKQRAAQLREKQRLDLKAELISQMGALGERAILPGDDTDDAVRQIIAKLVDQVERLTLEPRPLTSTLKDGTVLGSWELLYASNGT
ncbi:hypothetical protein CYMTET_49840, partial [Cymbomonas tetramitiformis]